MMGGGCGMLLFIELLAGVKSFAGKVPLALILDQKKGFKSFLTLRKGSYAISGGVFWGEERFLDV